MEKINGEQIYLRPIVTEDSEQIIRWRNSEDVRQFFIIQTDFTLESQHAWMKNVIEQGKAVQFIIGLCSQPGEKEIGSVYLKDIDRQNKKAEYGIFIGESDFRGGGYGTEAARLIIEYGFRALGLHKIYLQVFAENERARNSYRNAGFLEEALLKEEVYVRGKYHDIVRMAIFAPEGIRNE